MRSEGNTEPPEMATEVRPQGRWTLVPGRSPVSGLTWLLVFVPFVVVFLLIGLYAMAGGIALLAVISAWLARKWRRRNNDRPLIGFSGSWRIARPLYRFTDSQSFVYHCAGAHLGHGARPNCRDRAAHYCEQRSGSHLVSLCFGIPLGYVLAREKFAGKAMVEAIVDMPVVIPHTVAGIALLFIFGRAGILGGPLYSAFGILFSDSYWGIVLAMLFVGIPFVVNQSRDGFMKVDPRMENVARSLGASPLEAFLRVTIPLTWRSLLSAAIMTWAQRGERVRLSGGDRLLSENHQHASL